jgi:hypothetical protein
MQFSLGESALSQHLPGTDNTMAIISWLSGRDINLAPPEYDAGATHSTAMISN